MADFPFTNGLDAHYSQRMVSQYVNGASARDARMGAESPAKQHLPTVPSSFVGRDTDLAAIADLFGGFRLVTLVGPPGVGKTRLAVESARRMAEGYPDGVHLVELAEFDGAQQVAAAVSSGLGVVVDRHSTEAMTAAFGDRRLLMVLDNCEHLIEASAALVARLLEAWPGLSILATSREALAVNGEYVRTVEPLSLPAVDASVDPDQLAGSAAVRLFVERAAARRSDFVLTREVFPAVVEICNRLDGLPLAIELAATRTDVLGPAEIARRLDDRFSLLNTGLRTSPRRHQGLRASLDWSFELLSSAERLLFRRLAVFAGGWTLEAATSVCTNVAADHDTASSDVDADQVFDLIAKLVAKSLVVADLGSPPRFHLLGTVRQYAQTCLVDAGEVAETTLHHLELFQALAERAEPQLASGDQQVWLERLDTERKNLCAALAHAFDGQHAEQASRLATALVLWWAMRGRCREGLAWLARATECAVRQPSARAATLWGMGLLARQLGDVETATVRGRESLAVAEELDDTRLCARALGVLGAVGISAGEEPRAGMEQLEESIALARRAGDSWCEVSSLVPLGFAHLAAGEIPTARSRFQECMAVAERAGDGAGDGHRLHALIGFGAADLAVGELPGAERHLRRALDLARRLAIPSAGVSALKLLGEAARIRGDYESAERLLEESREIDLRRGPGVCSPAPLVFLGRLALTRGEVSEARSLLDRAYSVTQRRGGTIEGRRAMIDLGTLERVAGDLPAAELRLQEALAAGHRAEHVAAVARSLQELGRLARAGGDPERSASLLSAALRHNHTAGDGPGVVGCLESLAGLKGRDGHLGDAARLLGAAQALRNVGGYARPPIDQPHYDADLQHIRQALGRGFDGAWAQGAALTEDEAVSWVSADRMQGPRAEGGRPSLSSREREVVLLAVEGLTNQEIGEQLFISHRTVQSHLASVYHKLGIGSRTELAAQVKGCDWTLGRDMRLGHHEHNGRSHGSRHIGNSR